MPRVLNKLRDGVPPGAVYVGRPSKWGNPFAMSSFGDRKGVVAQYRKHLWCTPSLMSQLPELYDKDLVCFCAPLECHADVLIKAAAWHKRMRQEELNYDDYSGDNRQM